MATAQLTVHMRWLIRRDWPDVLAIEQLSFENPWAEGDLLENMRDVFTHSRAAELNDGGRIAGFMVYRTEGRTLRLLNLAVDPDRRRHGVGLAMLDYLKRKLDRPYAKRERIEALVRESNLDAQLFFRASRFRAEKVVRSPFDDSDESGYLFSFAGASAFIRTGPSPFPPIRGSEGGAV